MNSSADQLYDIAIIGAGLAGLCAAIQMAKKSYSVLLLEKQEFPFHRVCGEYISMESWNFMKNLGLPLDDMQLPRITRLKISAPNGTYLQQSLQPGGFGISRYTLDQELATIARSQGVTLLENTEVKAVDFKDNQHLLQSNRGEFRARLLLASWGKRSLMDKKLKRGFIEKPMPARRNFVAVKYHVRADLPTDSIELHNFEDGYCGISKVDGDRYCMCYLTTAAALQKCSNSIEELEQEVLMKNPFLKKYLSEFPKLYEAPLSISQVNFEPKQSVEQHILMLGDAAGLITPLCGNGMSMAMHASHLAAPLAAAFLNGSMNRAQLETTYTETWNRHFATRIKAGRKLQYLFGNKHISNISISALKHMPGLVSRLVGLTHGKEF